ncbi:phosphate transporter PHO1 [Quercus suber]|uniref:phosphate transporter PHO1 n=3 Tax=Quercus suber TaxID=58331 RepID=UPI000CE1BCCF|nr:phosphate transporter PHO1 [Quercus suber]POE77070.1 phosphate transporter pho1 [Quercus suber]
MVKFSKELEAQLIPEWKDAFVDYRDLKKQIKKMKVSKIISKPSQHPDGDFGVSIFDSIRFFAKKISDKFQNSENETDIIQVKCKSIDDGEDGVYVTDLSQLFNEEDEAKQFFKKLDNELNKVNQFYKEREDELHKKRENLNKQLQSILDLNQILNKRRRKNSMPSLNGGNSPRSWSSPDRSSSFSESSIELAESPEMSETEEVLAALERNGVYFMDSGTRTKAKNGKPKMAMKIDSPGNTPRSATSIVYEDMINHLKKESSGEFINPKKVQCFEKKIRGAFMELYKGLGLLRTYSSLNMKAFVKIMKKFDKVSNQNASECYLKAVKESHFISSDKVVRLMDEVESIFEKHFANNDRKKAMKFLRPQQRKASHMVTFFVGLFTGCFVSLFTVYALLAHLMGIFYGGRRKDYMNTVYPIFSMFALLSLHLFMHGCNLFMWKSKRINYNFIFESSPKTALTYRDAFLMCTTFMTIVVGALVIHLLLGASGYPQGPVDAIPGLLLLLAFSMLVCPFNIFYRPTRYRFIRIIRNIVCCPFFKVALVDFFMADQLTSQIPLLRHLETIACNLLARNFRTHHYETCSDVKLFQELTYVISFFPYYWRAMQCARRWFEEPKGEHLGNMGKYVSAMVAAGAKLTYERNKDDHVWFAMVLVTSGVATVYQLYWDFYRDWGLLRSTSTNLWLRDNLILKNKSIYYMSMALNAVLRVAWLETTMKIDKDSEKKLLDFLLASLEVIRRGHWNFYRLENEHLNNVGKYRAVKEVPLPFGEIDSDG